MLAIVLENSSAFVTAGVAGLNYRFVLIKRTNRIHFMNKFV